MASRGDIEAGKAYVTTYIKNSPFIKGINEIKAQLQGLGTNVLKLGGVISAAGALVTGPITAAVKQFVTMGTELQNVSRRTDVGVEALAEFKHAAEQTGAALGDIEGASKSVTKNIADAAMGSSGAAVALSRLGLSAAQLKQQKPEEQLQTVADRLAGIKDPAQQAALATQLLGGTNLLPMIGQLKALRQEARDMGLAPSAKAVADAANLGRMIKRQFEAVSAAIFEIGAAVAPVLMPVGEAIIRITGSVTRWIRENQEVVRTVFKIGSMITAAGAAITAVGALIFGIGTAFGFVASIVTGVVSAIGGIITVVTTIAGLLAPILIPLALIAAAVGGITTLLLRNQATWNLVSTTAKGVMADIVAAIAPYVEVVKTTIGGIVDSLMSGDIAEAGRIAMTALRLAFEVAKLAIVNGWFAIREKALAVWDSIAVAAAGAIAYIGSLFGSVFTALTGWDYGTALSAGWIAFRVAAVAAIDHVLLYIRSLSAAINAVRGVLMKTVKDVAVVVPQVINATAAASGIAVREVVGPDVAGAFDKAAAAADAAMDRAGADRDAKREEREAGADIWREEQGKLIAGLRDELHQRAADAKAKRAELKAGGAGDVAVRPPGGDPASGAALRNAFGTFSGLALGLGGSDGGFAKRQLAAQQEQRDLQKKQLDKQEEQRALADKLVKVMGVV
ncbi:hypothetical protein [Anatilimnocola floriformis]|uniref:hypothetical protein n=1 Tax=Anatilimnocola floriformis TaxID=2948575 RepID=UPI0020C4FF36|nr:hypothetical protein [Anatilimnocola floriformis]